MTSFSNFFSTAARKAEDPDEKDKIYRLRRMAIDSVHLVAAGANKRTFLIRKDEGVTMKTADMIPGAEGIKNSAGVVVTKADAMAGADDDLQKLIAKMEEDGSGSPEGLVDSLKSISKVLSNVAQKAEELPNEEEPPAEEGAEPPPPAEEDDTEKADPPEADAEAEKGDETTVAKSDPFAVIDAQLAVIKKAASQITPVSLATKAADLLQVLSGNLTTEEKKVVQEKVAIISKSLGRPANPTRIPDGNSNPTETPVAPSGGGWNSFEDINEK